MLVTRSQIFLLIRTTEPSSKFTEINSNLLMALLMVVRLEFSRRFSFTIRRILIKKSPHLLPIHNKKIFVTGMKMLHKKPKQLLSLGHNYLASLFDVSRAKYRLSISQVSSFHASIALSVKTKCGKNFIGRSIGFEAPPILSTVKYCLLLAWFTSCCMESI